MKKKKIKEAISKDHVAIILEDMQSQFKAFGDGQQLIRGDIKRLDEKVEILDKKVERHYKKFVEFEEDTKNNFKAVANVLTEMNDRLDNHENKIDRMQGDITEIKHKLSEKVDLKDFQNLEKRFLKLEKLVFAKLT